MRGHPPLPWWCNYWYDNALRRLLQDPEKILGPYVSEGMTVADIGCGTGYFSIPMARLVGDDGNVISVDINSRALKVLERRAGRSGVAKRVRVRHTEPDKIGVHEPLDFALTFWMLHEVPDRRAFLEGLLALLKPTGRWLTVEPVLHVTRANFEEMLGESRNVGFTLIARPRIFFSRSALLGKA